MTDAQKEQVRYLRCEGLGYGAIATRLGISENTVKSFCRRNNLTGVASKEPVVVCRNCGRPLPQYPKRKQRKFCSEACRRAWWKLHPEIPARNGRKPPSIRPPAPIAGRNFRAMGTGNGSIVPTPAT